MSSILLLLLRLQSLCFLVRDIYMFMSELAKRLCEFALLCQIRQAQHLRVSRSCVYGYWCLNHWITAARSEMSIIASMQYHAEKSPAHRHKPLATVGPTQEAMASAEGNKVERNTCWISKRARTQNGNFVSIEFFPPLFFVFSCEAQQSKKNRHRPLQRIQIDRKKIFLSGNSLWTHQPWGC